MIANSLDWKKIKLEDAPLEIIDGDRGTNYPKSDEFSDNDYCLFLNTSNVTVSGFNFFKCNFVSKERDEALRKGRLRKGDVILTTRGTVGNTAWVSEDIPYPVMRINSGMVILRTKPDELLPEFLCCFIKSIGFKDQVKTFSSGTAQPQLPITVLKKIKIPIPPLEEQKRIVEILDRAESLRAMRRQSIEHLNTLPEAIFLKMFGDPVKNPKNLSVEPLGDFLLFMTSGGRGWAQFYAQSGSRFIRSLDVQMNYIGDEDIAFVAPPDNAEARRTRVKTGDVLLTITGSRIGRVATVPDELEKSYVSQHVAILRTDPNRISPMFLAFFLSLSTGGQRQIAKYQYGQTKPGLNFEQIKRFQIPLPSINLQQEFVQRVEAIEKLKTTHQKSLTELDALFASLQHRAFKGEL